MTQPPAPPSTVPTGAPAVQLNIEHYRQRADEVKRQQARAGGFRWQRPNNICYITGGDNGWRCCRMLGPYSDRQILERPIFYHWGVPGYKYPLPSLKTWPQLGLEDPIDEVLTELDKQKVEYNGRMWSQQKVWINGIMRLWDPHNPGVVTGEWDPREHDPDQKGPAAVKARVLELPMSVWDWVVGQLSIMLTQPTPMNPAMPEWGLDLHFRKGTGNNNWTEYKDCGFLYVPGPVVSDPALLAQIKGSITDLDAECPPPEQESISMLKEIAQQIKAHYGLIASGPMTTHPGAAPAASTTPSPAAVAPVVQPPAPAQPPAVTATAETKFWVVVRVGEDPQLRTKSDIDAGLTTNPAMWDTECVMTEDQVSGWKKPSDLGFTRAAAPASEAAPAPVAAPVAPPAASPPFVGTQATQPVQPVVEKNFWCYVGDQVVSKTLAEARTLDPNTQAQPHEGGDGSWKPISELLALEVSPPTVAPAPPPADDFDHPDVERAFDVSKPIKGQYDGAPVDPATRPTEHRVTPDASAKVPQDKEFCFGLDHDPRRRGEVATSQGMVCLSCTVESICRLERIKRDPEFYAGIGYKVDGHRVIPLEGQAAIT